VKLGVFAAVVGRMNRHRRIDNVAL
jgi:hypothetical protein